MSTLTTYSGLQVVTPDPIGAGGLAINNNFKALATHIDTIDPTACDDNTHGFSAGSRWYNSSTANEWICLSAVPGAASWTIIIGVLTGTESTLAPVALAPGQPAYVTDTGVFVVGDGTSAVANVPLTLQSLTVVTSGITYPAISIYSIVASSVKPTWETL